MPSVYISLNIIKKSAMTVNNLKPVSTEEFNHHISFALSKATGINGWEFEATFQQNGLVFENVNTQNPENRMIGRQILISNYNIFKIKSMDGITEILSADELNTYKNVLIGFGYQDENL